MSVLKRLKDKKKAIDSIPNKPKKNKEKWKEKLAHNRTIKFLKGLPHTKKM